jgi:hypothetical protein
MNIFSSAASRAKKAAAEERAKKEADDETAKAAKREADEETYDKWWAREKIARPKREAEESEAEVAAKNALSELANRNNQEIEKIFKDKFKPFKESITVQFQEIKNNIKKDLIKVINDSKNTIEALDINLATITMNSSLLNNEDTLLANLNLENLVNMLNTYEEQCKKTLKNYLGSGVAIVKVTKIAGEPKPYNPRSISSEYLSNLYTPPQVDGYRYRWGGSSRSSKKRIKPIKKRRNTKRRN